MKLIKTEDAVGQVLCHDITQIIKGVTKDAVFRKGHIITEEDIPVLLSVGKDHIYIWEKDDTILHENEAAQILYEMCKNDHMHPSDVKEGKIELIADCNGLLKVDKEKLTIRLRQRWHSCLQLTLLSRRKLRICPQNPRLFWWIPKRATRMS